jgi:hypothetical protein
VYKIHVKYKLNYYKELSKMSFINVFEELNKLYESEELETEVDEVTEEFTTEDKTEEKPLIEVIEDDDAQAEEAEEIDEVDESTYEEARQVVLECANCGAVVLKTEADVAVDEDSDLANVGEACQYCEETEGYKILGVVAPYETDVANIVEDELEEGIFDSKKKKAAKNDSLELADSELNKLTKGKGIYALGGALFGLYTEALHQLYTKYKKEFKDSMQFNNAVNDVDESAKNGIAQTIKALSKPNSLYSVIGALKSGLTNICPDLSEVDAYRKLDMYDEIAAKFSEISFPEKSTHTEVTKIVAKDVQDSLTSFYNDHKSADKFVLYNN